MTTFDSSRFVHPAALAETKLIAECEVRRTRRSGPGGQHRNKVETAVLLRHQPTGIEAEAGERRSQNENRNIAIFRLRVNLALNVRTESSKPVEPSELWQQRCRNRRLAVNPQHADFPTLLAEALDTIHHHNDDLHGAAECLGCSHTQLVRFLKLDPRAFQQINAARRAAGRKELK